LPPRLIQSLRLIEIARQIGAIVVDKLQVRPDDGFIILHRPCEQHQASTGAWLRRSVRRSGREPVETAALEVVGLRRWHRVRLYAAADAVAVARWLRTSPADGRYGFGSFGGGKIRYGLAIALLTVNSATGAPSTFWEMRLGNITPYSWKLL